jgi:thymidylate synthase (FAD)
MSTVSLISVTPNAEKTIAYCARVSNPLNQDNPESEKLIRYLIKHNHWSPFEMAHVVIEISTTRAIAAQILRHRSFSFQEFSQRYADVSSLSFAKPPALRQQDLKNRQNSTDTLDGQKVRDYHLQIGCLYQKSELLYKQMINDGVAKECAREILPLGTPTRLYMSGTVRSWIHYVDLRSANGTQLEHQQIATQCGEVLDLCLPMVMKAYRDVRGS